MLDPILIAIGGLGLLGLMGVALLAQRLGRIEQGLERLEQLDDLDRRLRDLSAEFDRKELNTQLQAKMTEVTEANRRLGHALVEVRDELAGLREAGPLVGAAEPAAEAPEPDVSQAVREHLLERGFDEVHILADLNRLEGRSGRVVFEGRRHGVMHKGHVSVQDGAVVDLSERAAYSAFP